MLLKKPLSFSDQVVTVVAERLRKENIKLNYPSGFNSYVLTLIIDFYDVKNDPNYSYKHVIGNNPQFTYSQQFIDFIISEVRKNPTTFVESLKKAKEKR